MRLYLHIGAEKTGTTSVQTFLNVNSSRLGEQGFYVPKSLGDGSHRWLPVLAYNEDRIDEFIRSNNLLEYSVRKRKIHNRLNLLREELENVSARSVIMTSEHLQSRLTTFQEVRRVLEILEPYFSKISVIFYLRDPFSMAVSLYSTSLRAGGVMEDIFSPKDQYIQNTANYKKTISNWENVFGPHNMILRLYEKGCISGGDIISDFCKIVGINREVLISPRSKNSSLSSNALQILREFNQICKDMEIENTRVLMARERVVDVLEKRFSNLSPFRGSLESQKLYHREFKEANEWVRSKYFPNRDQLFSVASVRSEGDWPLDPELGRSVASSYIDLLLK